MLKKHNHHSRSQVTHNQYPPCNYGLTESACSQVATHIKQLGKLDFLNGGIQGARTALLECIISPSY